MKEAEQKQKEERRQELETIRIRQAADEIFRRNEEEKRTRKFEENRHLAGFHLSQAVSICFQMPLNRLTHAHVQLKKERHGLVVRTLEL